MKIVSSRGTAARTRAYEAVALIGLPGSQHRRDIAAGR